MGRIFHYRSYLMTYTSLGKKKQTNTSASTTLGNYFVSSQYKKYWQVNKTEVWTIAKQYRGSEGGAVMRALASHRFGPGSNPVVDATCGLSVSLVLSLAPRGFSPGTQAFPSSQKPIFPNSNPIWNARTSLNEWLRILHGTHCHSLSYNRSSQATFSQIGWPVATQSSLKSIVAISPSSGKTRAMLSAVVPANVPGKQKMHLLVSWLV